MTSQKKPISKPPLEPAASLDPQDWPAFRRLCHDMLDKALDHLEGVADGPVWRAPPEAVKQALSEPLPLAPQGAERAAADLLRWILPYGTGNTHPRFFGWVHGAGTPGGLLAFSPSRKEAAGSFVSDGLVLNSGHWRSTDGGETWEPAAVGREPRHYGIQEAHRLHLPSGTDIFHQNSLN